MIGVPDLSVRCGCVIMKKLGVDPTVDFAFRKLFGDPGNKAFADDKLSILDIKARDEDGRWINVEMQTTIAPALRNRLVYYTSALYSSQLLEGESYTAVTPAICICFLSRVLFPLEQNGHLTFSLREQTRAIQLTEDVQIHTIELPKYNQGELITVHSEVKLSRWAWFMNNASEKSAEELRGQLPNGPMHKAVGVLERIAQSPYELHIYQSRQKAIRVNSLSFRI